jgi:KDO2-lipid IV(A) lauroyltransferase
VSLLAALPLANACKAPSGFAWLARSLVPYRPAVIRESLALAFPERSVEARERIRHDFYRGYGDVMMELVKSASMPGEELDQRMRFANLDALRAEIATGTPVLLLAAHQCNWEWILLGLSRQLGYPVDAAYKPLKNDWADREMLALRSRFGARMIPADRVVRSRGAVFRVCSRSSPIRSLWRASDVIGRGS